MHRGGLSHGKEKQARDVRQEVTDAIVKKLEAGVMPWRRGWSSAEQAKDALLLPRNGETGRAYRGGNRLYLMTMMQEKGWSDPRFMTFNQLQKLDAGPRKGEKGLPVEYWDELPFWKRRDVDVLLCGEKVKVHAVDPQLKSQPLATTDAMCTRSRCLSRVRRAK